MARSLILRFFAVTAGALAIAAVAIPSAFADIDGPCQATIAGENVKGRGTGALSDAIVVEKDATVPVSMSAGSEISYLKVQIEFAGISWTVHDEPSTGSSWAKEVNVDDYAKYGVGLYKVVGSSSGGVSCSGAALVKVKGNPLTTVAGIAGLVVALGGIAGVAGALIMALHSGALGLGSSLLGLFGGLFGGLGLAVLAQQFALVYPTAGVAAVFVGGGAVIGIGMSVLGKLLGAGAAAAA